MTQSPDGLSRFADEVRQIYQEPVAGAGSRIERGQVLWAQLEQILAEARASGDGLHSRPLAEKMNELAVAKALLDDRHLAGTIQYEPNILPSGRRIDFVAIREADKLYVEVKTIHPKTVDSKDSWNRFLELRQHHPANVEVLLEQDSMGGQIYANLIASRSKFLAYALDFESRLQEAKGIVDGPGALVFCGTGFPWRLGDLEDFADFYRLGNHRQDDAFRIMEQHSMEQHGQVLLGNIDHICFLKRAVEQPLLSEFKFSVRGLRNPFF
jgi:hypothetical protein